ncbi:MAG: hypothetical protein J5I93_05540 [Pirellulaceae bacterium]|nr:hypothetical protein [Pirellulaceae bacterium]
MWNQLVSLAHSALKQADTMNAQQWMAACAVLLGIGFLCLRGFGSRSNY